jgi:maleylacetate reductase
MVEAEPSMTEQNNRRIGWCNPGPSQTIAFGVSVTEGIPKALQQLDVSRIVLATTNSLARPNGLGERVREALGVDCVSVVSDIRAHTPRSDVMRLVNALRDADGVVSLGGGSVCDAVKAARICLANAIFELDDIDRVRASSLSPGLSGRAAITPPTLPFVAIPTTLSAGEYTSFAGVTDERGGRKEALASPGMAPDIVLLDPAMTLATPPQLWFATGVRAVDHAVETWCAHNATPFSDATSLHAMRLMVGALRRSHADWEDLSARQDCLEAAWLAIQGLAMGVDAGASHGIGHALGGTAGMPHGETSCVMLPHVLRYNAPINAARQAALAEAVGQPERTLADIVAELVAVLGLPGRLRDAGVRAEQIGAITAASMRDPWVHSNPRPLPTQADVHSILQSAW